ncbi:MAG: BREX-3 system P-loop-containing protein BrxF [Spirochaetales bacterium]|jgi:Cdc6-like AAA superfamily ATPase|nr:BREX-3 system P-loop-containing protein BrxF [Spirochaetales bacterium]
MTNSQQIVTALSEVEGLYHRLVFLVGETGSGKTMTLQDVSQQLDLQPLNVNLELSEQLLELTAKQRTLQLPRFLEDLVSDKGQTVILDNIEILFDVDLQQDPLRLLQRISRNRNIVVAWNGRVADKKLIYAEPGHPEYRNYAAPDFIIVPTTRQEE